MSDSDKDQFIFPKEPYRGDFKFQKVAFNANLQEFARKVNVICNLETNGKISQQDAYQQIKDLWKQLKSSRKTLKADGENEE